MSSFEVLPFYRGVSARYSMDVPTLHSPRTNRRPRSSPNAFHRIADDWFFKRFGIRYRSHSLFVTPSKFIARNYGATPDHLIRIIPITDYRFCWSPSVSDLLFAAQKLEKATLDEIESYLDQASYREEDLKAAHSSGHEVMLYCQHYIAIPDRLLDQNATPEQPRILV